MIKDKKEASIKKEMVTLKTYPYSDPSPIPEFGRLYPYNRYDGYTNDGVDQDWEMIVMENEHIKLWLNPAVGGKVWGAIEKATLKEFIYFNHSAKFRDVAMRGPWTSGGMETNMGIIGHTPSCSAAVDHFTRTNADGSVSCFISATDWPSRTNWTVEINLPADAAYFISRSSWYNNSGQEQSYYQWNNVGVKTAGDLEYIQPGTSYLGHDGRRFNWPKDEKGREISRYEKNNFGEYKSYHVVGSYSDFWGCYWHQDDFGFGHSSAYDEKPGKKIWIWGLSRYGMVWEDLLTDTDGQYTELQSGRMFNQSIASSSKTPFKHRSFLPYSFDNWDEYWFPVKNTGGLVYGNEQLSFNLVKTKTVTALHICANQRLNHKLKIECDGKPIIATKLMLKAMATTIVDLPGSVSAGQLKIWLNDSLIYNGPEQEQQLSRPSVIHPAYRFDTAQAIYLQAKEWERQRFFDRAITQYRACLKKDPFYIEALNGLAGILIRQAQTDKALKLVMTALSVDTYNAEANYLYGIINARLNAHTDAKDGFSIASLSPAYRSAAYTELAKLFLKEKQFDKATDYVNKALQANLKNQQALHLSVVINRLSNNGNEARLSLKKLLQQNPLDHLARLELYLLDDISAGEFQRHITSELPYETYLELSCFYLNIGLYDTCLTILSMSPHYAMVDIYKAYIFSLQGLADKVTQYIGNAAGQFPDLVFPHRYEDVLVLEWAVANYSHWKFKYYLSLAYIQMQRKDEAFKLLAACKNGPDFYVFYIIRANVCRELNEDQCEDDLREAIGQGPLEWRAALTLSKYLGEKNRWSEALTVANKALLRPPGNYYLGLHLANCLLRTGAWRDGITLMNNLYVLPNEGALDGRNIWKETYLFAALQAIQEEHWKLAHTNVKQARKWPENLGVGKPYEVDERLENFLELYCEKQTSATMSEHLMEYVMEYHQKYPGTAFNSNDFLTIYLLQQNSRYDEAQQLLDQWLLQNPDDLAAHWSSAFMSGDTEELNVIAMAQPKKQEKLPYELSVEDRSFGIIKEMYNRDFFDLSFKAAE